MQYQANIIKGLLSRIMKSGREEGHKKRITAAVLLLQGLLFLKQGSLSGMGKGIAIIYEKGFRGQLKRAYRWVKNEAVDSKQTAINFYQHMTSDLKEVGISVDWTDIGYFKVLEASLQVEGRGIPFYSISIHRDELGGRQTAIELSMWYALCEMRMQGQTMLVTADRGFAKFDFIGQSPEHSYMHLMIRLKRSMILTWGSISGKLGDWPLYSGEVVEIEECNLGREKEIVTAVCIANLGEDENSLYLACHKGDLARAVELYKRRPWIEQQIRDEKSNFICKKLHLSTAQRLDRMLLLIGIAFYISYCNESIHDSKFADRMSRKYKDGRRDLSWLNLAKYAELCGQVDLVLNPIMAQ
jgi:hypothetical protein